MAVIAERPNPGLTGFLEELKNRYPIVLKFEVESGADRDGDPAAWVTLVIGDDASPVGPDGRLKDDADRPGGLLAAVEEIEQEIKREGFVPNVHFRTTSEQDLVDADRAQRSS